MLGKMIEIRTYLINLELDLYGLTNSECKERLITIINIIDNQIDNATE